MTEIEQYMSRAHEMLHVAEHTLNQGFYSTAVNRSYYAIFYAAHALILTRGIHRSKHSGTIAAFRQYFVKTGLIEPQYSDIYGDAMEVRQVGDYEILGDIQEGTARSTLTDARAFVARIEDYLKQEGYL